MLFNFCRGEEVLIIFACVRLLLSVNRSWRPMELLDVEASTLTSILIMRGHELIGLDALECLHMCIS
jgi:hypothetical protein